MILSMINILLTKYKADLLNRQDWISISISAIFVYLIYKNKNTDTQMNNTKKLWINNTNK